MRVCLPVLVRRWDFVAGAMLRYAKAGGLVNPF